MMGVLEDLTEDKIMRMCREDVFSRGRDYFAKGRVLEIIKTEEGIMAKVAGRSSSPYSVRIEGRDNRLESSCTCPYGGFCKHRVAVLLSLMKGEERVTRISTEDIGDYLYAKGKGELVDLILDHMSSDTDFMRSIYAEVQREAKGGIETSFFKGEIERLLNEAWYIEYPDVPGYVRELEELARKIQSLVESGFAGEACELLFYFIRQSIKALEKSGIDDSSGSFGWFITSLGEPCKAALKASKGEVTISAEEVVDSYLKARDYGLDDCFDPILRELPEEVLLHAEKLSRERVEEAKDEEKFWRSVDERFLLATILALLGREREYTELCAEWGEEEWIGELKKVEMERREVFHERS